MAISDDRLRELAQQMAGLMGSPPVERPKPTLVGKGNVVPFQRQGLDPQTRDVIYSRIRDLSKMYWLAWLVRQETAHVNCVIECLTDDALCKLRDDMERARECRVEGIAFDDAGLVRSHSG